VNHRTSLRYPSAMGSDRSCTGFKPSQAEQKSQKGIGISGLQKLGYRKSRGQEIGSLHSENPEFDLSHPFIRTRGGDQEPVGISATGVSS
jgi:hypothetical protein